MPESVAVLGISAVILIVSIWILYKPFLNLCKTFLRARHLSLVKIVSGDNTDEQAKNDFLQLIEDAEECIEIFDDGDDMEESIYQKEEVVTKIKEKLRQVRDFKIDCFFNDDNELLFIKELENEYGVNITAGIDSSRPPGQTHYKIADNGRIAYLSNHGRKESERNYRLLDCRALSENAFNNTKGYLFDKYQKEVRETVSKMKGVVT